MEDNGELLNIEISSSDEVTTASKPARDYQSEENFRFQKASWKPKIENGQVISPRLFEIRFLTLNSTGLEVTSSSYK
jgi:hypothetical protein